MAGAAAAGVGAHAGRAGLRAGPALGLMLHAARIRAEVGIVALAAFALPLLGLELGILIVLGFEVHVALLARASRLLAHLAASLIGHFVGAAAALLLLMADAALLLHPARCRGASLVLLHAAAGGLLLVLAAARSGSGALLRLLPLAAGIPVLV
jgi:hypothetical protein